MIKKLSPALALLVLVLAGPGARAACDAGDARAMDWLDRMSRSLREVSYSGVFTYESDGRMQTLRISHTIANGMESEQLTRLTGDRGVVMRTEHPLDCIHPGSRLVRIGESFADGDGDCGLAEHYQLRLGARDRVAGRYAQILHVMPRDMYRYGYQMALDSETGLLLKSQTLAQDGKILERFQFADLDLGDTDAAGTEVEVLHHAGHPTHHHHAQAPASAARGALWQVGWIPAGFTLTHGEGHSDRDKTFTDGLAVFSVFLEPMTGDLQPGEGRARQGGTIAYTRGLQLQGKPVVVTVVFF